MANSTLSDHDPRDQGFVVRGRHYSYTAANLSMGLRQGDFNSVSRSSYAGGSSVWTLTGQRKESALTSE